MKASVKQATLLEQLNLPVPTDKQAASSFIGFAFHGNGNLNHSEKERRALIRDYWSRWVGKLVKIIQVNHRFHGVCGRVEYLRARTEKEVRQIIATHSARKPHPFIAVIRLGPDKSKDFVEVHLTGLKRVKEGQMRLFLP